MFVFDAKDEAAVSEIGEGDGDNPGNDVGGLEFKGVFWVEDGENEGIISDKTDKCSHNADDKVADEFAVFGEELIGHW